MHRLIILLAAVLLTLTLACKAAGGLSNALQNEVGETGGTEQVEPVPEDGIWAWVSDRYGVRHRVKVTPAELEGGLTEAERETIMLRSGITGHSLVAQHPDTGLSRKVEFTHEEAADGIFTDAEIRNAFARTPGVGAQVVSTDGVVGDFVAVTTPTLTPPPTPTPALVAGFCDRSLSVQKLAAGGQFPCELINERDLLQVRQLHIDSPLKPGDLAGFNNVEAARLNISCGDWTDATFVASMLEGLPTDVYLFLEGATIPMSYTGELPVWPTNPGTSPEVEWPYTIPVERGPREWATWYMLWVVGRGIGGSPDHVAYGPSNLEGRDLHKETLLNSYDPGQRPSVLAFPDMGWPYPSFPKAEVETWPALKEQLASEMNQTAQDIADAVQSAGYGGEWQQDYDERHKLAPHRIFGLGKYNLSLLKVEVGIKPDYDMPDCPG